MFENEVIRHKLRASLEESHKTIVAIIIVQSREDT